MLDLHCHILPGVDDGADNLSDSVEMAKLAQASGVHGIVATPHCNLPGNRRNEWSAELEQKLNCLQQKLRQTGSSVSIYPGQEVFLSADYLGLLRGERLIGLNRSRYLLVEFGMNETLSAAAQKLQRVSAEGWVPVVAHPERYGFLQEQGDAVLRLRRAGGLLQLNKGSLMGAFGRTAMETAHRILRHRQADFVASDAHGPYRRTTVLTEVHEMISECYSNDYADLLLKANPARVIDNMEIFHD